MSTLSFDMVGLVLSIPLFFFLLYTLLFPERF